MRLVIGTIGTRGDVQPMVALARALKRAGFDVVLATHDEFEDLAKSAGVPFKAAGGNARAVMETELGRAWLESGSNPIRYQRLLKKLWVPLQRRMLEDADRAVEGADAVIHYPLACGYLYAAERRRLPVISTPFVPFVPTGESPPVLFPGAPRFAFVRRSIGLLMLRALWGPLRTVHNEFRRSVGLQDVAAKSFAEHAFLLGVPHLHLLSETLFSRPKDWPASATLSGFCFLDSDPGYQPPRELTRFLEAGEPPIYLGFGSMTGVRPRELAEIAIAAIERAGVRAVVVSGWSGITAHRSSENIFFADDVPHDWLFPRVSAVVHHGGIGTTAAGLRAGRPAVVVPFFGDQPFWARRVCELGVGPEPIPRRKLDSDRLARAIREATSNPAIRARAQELGNRINHENGLAVAVKAIETHLLSKTST